MLAHIIMIYCMLGLIAMDIMAIVYLAIHLHKTSRIEINCLISAVLLTGLIGIVYAILLAIKM